MNIIKNVYLIGMGAVGAVYAGRISENCPGSLRIIASEERIERYNSAGIRINGKSPNFTFICPNEANAKADLIIIAVKQHHLAQVITDIKNLVGEDTIILSLLNGISSEDILGKEYGMGKLLYSFCVGKDAVRKGKEIKL